jgi:hypothetical protein
MLPDIHDPVWAGIISGKRPLQSTKPTFNLLIQGNKMSYERDPSPANVEVLIARTHKFLRQYEALFADEIAALQ